jgi:hypothetical protein
LTRTGLALTTAVCEPSSFRKTSAVDVVSASTNVERAASKEEVDLGGGGGCEGSGGFTKFPVTASGAAVGVGGETSPGTSLGLTLAGAAETGTATRAWEPATVIAARIVMRVPRRALRLRFILVTFMPDRLSRLRQVADHLNKLTLPRFPESKNRL